MSAGDFYHLPDPVREDRADSGWKHGSARISIAVCAVPPPLAMTDIDLADILVSTNNGELLQKISSSPNTSMSQWCQLVAQFIELVGGQAPTNEKVAHLAHLLHESDGQLLPASNKFFNDQQKVESSTPLAPWHGGARHEVKEASSPLPGTGPAAGCPSPSKKAV
eukprot:gene1166-2672_t